MTDASRRSDLRSGLPALACCLLVIVLLAAFTPAEDKVRRQYRATSIGRLASNRDFQATVTGVDIGKKLLRNEYQPVLRSSGVFVVATISAQSPTKTVNYTGIELITTDGRTYQPRDEFATNALQMTQPGFGTTGVAVFELPPDRLPGAQLIIGPDAGTFEVYATMIRVDLELTEDAPYVTHPIELHEATTEAIP